MERNEFLRKEWGGLSPRAVTFLKKLCYKTLLEIQQDPPTEEKVFWTKGVGIYLFNEIKSVVELKPGEHPVEVITRSPAPWLSQSRQPEPAGEKPVMYITKASPYRKALDNPAAPELAKQLAEFLDTVVKFARMVPLDETLPSDIPCMAGPQPRHWCLGVVDVCWGNTPLRIHWECPLCGKKGVVTDVEPPPLFPTPPTPRETLH